jgi:hypothetical protein
MQYCSGWFALAHALLFSIHHTCSLFLYMFFFFWLSFSFSFYCRSVCMEQYALLLEAKQQNVVQQSTIYWKKWLVVQIIYKYKFCNDLICASFFLLYNCYLKEQYFFAQTYIRWKDDSKDSHSTWTKNPRLDPALLNFIIITIITTFTIIINNYAIHIRRWYPILSMRVKRMIIKIGIFSNHDIGWWVHWTSQPGIDALRNLSVWKKSLNASSWGMLLKKILQGSTDFYNFVFT